MSAPLVVDASAIIACASPDETASPALTKAIATQQLIAPGLWPFEVHNVLHLLQRKGRLQGEAHAAALAVLVSLRVEIEPSSPALVAGAVTALAQTHGLTIYDAAYLELAQRRSLPLATLDGDLIKAAKKEKVKLL